MCEAKHYTEQLLGIYKEIKNKVYYYCDQLSQADLYEQDILHIIEMGGFNASEGYKLAKMLCDNRHKRRQIKNELEPLKQLKENFINHNMEALDKTYQAVIRKDKILNNLSDNKIYKPRILQTTNIKSVVDNKTIMQDKKTAVYNKTGETVIILRQDSDHLCYCLRENGRDKNFLRLKDLIIEKNNINN